MNDIFKALSDPTRRRILELLMEKDMNAGEISKISHSEKAWLDNQASHAEISYQNAFSLNF